jgi:hypothetical protein
LGLENVMPDQDYKSLFSDDDWISLQACVPLVCRDAANGCADDRGWHEIDRFLEEWAAGIAGSDSHKDLALTVLATLADDSLRSILIAIVRDVMASASDSDLDALTARAGRLVDRACPQEGFEFRATLILISQLVLDRASTVRLERQ